MFSGKLPNALTIAGSDSGGGAGIQADLKTFASLGVYGTSVITALTAQNGMGVTGIHAPSADFVIQQLRAVLDGFPIHAAKTGMLFSAEIIEALANELKHIDFPLVLDPVCVSTSGHRLIEENAVEVMKEKLFPLATLITPNKPETEVLTGVKLVDNESVEKAGKMLLDMGAKAVLIKGGHFDEKPILVTDWFLDSTGIQKLQQPHVDTQNSHGTGCTLSSAITAYLAKDQPLIVAIKKAQEYLNCALRNSYAPGKGIGPVHHLATIEQLNHGR